MDNDSIKSNIRNFRNACRMTQEEMALKMNISLTAYRDLEKGRTAIISNNLQKVAEILEISMEELLLGYKPAETVSPILEDVRDEYGGRITVLETRVADLENLVRSHEETIRSKNEIIEMLKKSLAE